MRNPTLFAIGKDHVLLGSQALLVAAALFTLCAVAAANSGMNAVPFVSTPLIPTSIRPGGPGFTLTINGAGFVSGSIVKWNGTPRVTTFVSHTQVTALILSSDVAKAATASITVFSPAPGGGTSNVEFFQVTNQQPAVGLGTKGTCSNGLAAVADFNKDGRPDIAVFNVLKNGTISIMLGNGDGLFQTRASYFTKDNWSAAVGDFNADGNVDLVVGSFEGQGVDIFLGNGDGTFQTRRIEKTGTGPAYLAIGDFNEDGNLDIAAANDNDRGNISILFGNGDGTFQPYVDIQIGRQPGPILAADVNNDGRLDLVVGDFDFVSGSIFVLLGKGDGTFQSPLETPIGLGPNGLVAADLDGDGNQDLVFSSYSNHSISVLKGHGDGSFSEPTTYAIAGEPFFLTIGDFNADGRLDLAVDGDSTSALNLLSIFLGGDGTFGPPTIHPSSSILRGSIFAADFNGDGRLDLENGCDWLQTPRALTFNVAGLTFPNQTVFTTSAAQQVKLTNSGTQAVTISNITTNGDFAEINDCPSTLDILKGCTITVTFTPTAVGPRTGSILVTDDAINSPQSLPLTGSASEILLSPTSIAFGSQAVGTTSPVQTITVTNEGTETIHIGLIGLEGLNPTDFAQSNNCPAKIGAGVSCTINVTFTPTQTGIRRAFVGLRGQFLTILMNGTGT
jgi:hypothetical protein